MLYDQQHSGQITKDSKAEGVQDSDFYLIFLSKDIFFSDFVRYELRTAVNSGKQIIFMHHPETNTETQGTFGDFIDSAPEDLRSLFNENESIPFRRRKYEQIAMMNELERRYFHE